MSTELDFGLAIQYLCLGGTSIYSWYCVGGENFLQGCYGSIVLNSMFGFIQFGINGRDNLVNTLFRYTRFIVYVLALPFLTTHIWLQYEYPWQIGVLHTIFSFFPIIISIENGGNTQSTTFLDCLTIFNSTSMGIISILNGNYWGANTAFCMAFNYFVWFRNEVTTIIDGTEVFCLYLFVFFVSKSIIEEIKEF